MTIELTKDQYRSLLRLTFLGEWMANSFREERLDEFEAIDQHLLSYAKKFGADDMAEFDKKLKQWFPTKEMELEMHEFIDEYHDDFFPEELVYQLGQRDARKEHGKAYQRMTPEERIRADEPFLEKYYDEIGRNGIRNIRIVDARKGDAAEFQIE